jgi:hypothetical protein
MAISPLSRRAFLRHMPIAAVAAGALVSTAAIAKPVFVKVGSPSLSVPPEVMEAIREWKAAVLVKEAADADYYKLIEVTRRIPDNDPTRNASIDADHEATRAQWKLLKLLRSYDS